MSNSRFFRSAIAFCLMVFLPLALALPASALSMKECSVKYKAAQSAGEAEGISWGEFRKTQCATPAADAASQGGEPEKADQQEAKPDAGKEPQKEVKKAEANPASGKTTFPSSVAAKFTAEKPSKARMHTCLEQYRANKAANTLGGTRWIEKGGGYYAKCNARLKGKD